jgi:hypothetical protein
LISTEYGWTDEQILDLPLARFHQIQDLIISRRRAEREQQVRLVELQTRYLVSAFSGKKAADAVTFLPPEPRQRVLPTVDDLTARYGQPLLRLEAAHA